MLGNDLVLDVIATTRKLTCPVKGVVVDTAIHPSDNTGPVVELRIYESQIKFLNLEERRLLLEHLARMKAELQHLPVHDVWITGVNGEPPE